MSQQVFGLRAAGLAVSSLALLAALPAFAQSRVESAADRVAADNAPLGVRAGSFLVIPKVDVEGTFDDNIYAANSRQTDDFILTVRPEVAVKSNWNRHALNAVANVEAKRYNDKDAEDVENFRVALDGRADVLRETSIGGGIAIAREHEDRGAPNSVAAALEPTELNTVTARLGAFRGLGPANVRFDTEVRNLDYENGRTAANTVVNNNLRDRNEYTQTLRVGYRFTPSTEAFIRGTVDNRVYDFKGSNAVAVRSNQGQTYVAGLDFDLTGKAKAQVFAGQTERNYVARTLKDISEATWGADVTYNLSDLTTLKGGIARTIEETTSGAASGYLATVYSTAVEHALRRNLLATAGVEYAQNEYQGFAANQREDETITARAGLDYWLHRCWKTGIGYEYVSRDSSVANNDYDRNRVMLKLTATY